ncbi:hypothetical protein RFEPED_1431 [Rickettsia felis str. Pedreira]|uniref:Uncharacterized protein n=1 Tax=Rickettsia felis str. Pedreira TaxID=1359196 RepID=A0A0F3MTM2_RICFI|nr:hypothetical protein RFEPED_1431 [Rickettsia felis str. Pedreira]
MPRRFAPRNDERRRQYSLAMTATITIIYNKIKIYNRKK